MSTKSPRMNGSGHDLRNLDPNTRAKLDKMIARNTRHRTALAIGMSSVTLDKIAAGFRCKHDAIDRVEQWLARQP